MSQFLNDPKFWVAVATFTFLALVFKPAKSLFFSSVDAKIATIKKALEDASRLKNEAEALLQEAQTKLAQSEAQAGNIIAHAKSEAEGIVTRTKLKLEKDIENRKKAVLSKIKSLEETGLEEIKKNISTMTIMATHTILEENIDEEISRRLSEESLDKITKVTLH